MAENRNGASDGRDERGYFLPGNKIAKGNPHAKRMFQLRKELLDAIPEGTFREVTTKLCELAKGGDLAAIKLLFDHAMGRPPQALEITGPDGGNLGIGIVELRALLLGVLEPFGPGAKIAVAETFAKLAASQGGDRA
jgi:hypothetical protein